MFGVEWRYSTINKRRPAFLVLRLGTDESQCQRATSGYFSMCLTISWYQGWDLSPLTLATLNPCQNVLSGLPALVKSSNYSPKHDKMPTFWNVVKTSFKEQPKKKNPTQTNHFSLVTFSIYAKHTMNTLIPGYFWINIYFQEQPGQVSATDFPEKDAPLLWKWLCELFLVWWSWKQFCK